MAPTYKPALPEQRYAPRAAVQRCQELPFSHHYLPLDSERAPAQAAHTLTLKPE